MPSFGYATVINYYYYYADNHKKKFMEYVTESAKTSLIARDRKFTQTQSLMNALSNITATDSQSKGICFFSSTVASHTSSLWP